jgi:pyruvate carboxylase subunit B
VEIDGRRVTVDIDGEQVTVDGERSAARLDDIEGAPESLLTIDGEVHRVIVRRAGARGQYALSLAGYRFTAEALDERTRAIRDLSAATAAPTGPAPLVAPMSGMIVSVSVAAGDEVRPGQGLVVMEAMKMENELRAQTTGRVKSVAVAPGQAVEKGALLVALE